MPLNTLLISPTRSRPLLPPRAFFIATLLLGTNLKVYQEKNDLNNYYFTLSKLCSLNITANETSSLEFLMDEFKLLDLQEPLEPFSPNP